MDEARDAMREMLGRLKQTHFGIVPVDAYQELDEKGDDKGGPSDGDPGIDVRQVDGHTLVTFVTPGSPAEAKGVKLDGKSCGSTAKSSQRAWRRCTKRSPSPPCWRNLLRHAP